MEAQLASLVLLSLLHLDPIQVANDTCTIEQLPLYTLWG